VTRLFAGVVALVACTAPAAAQNWPSFRGPDASGVAPSPAAAPVEWNLETSRHVAWRTPIPGLAHSSPIVWGDRIYLTTAEAASGKPRVITGDSSKAGIDPADDMVAHTWRLMAIDKQSGRVVWNTVAHRGVPRMKRHLKASHASATPATDGRSIVALFDSEGLFCFDMTGTLKWRKDLGVMDVGLVDDPTYQWGPASSPVLYGDLVIVQNDRHKDSFLAAYALADGHEVWRASRDEMPSWSTPLVFHGRARTEIVTNSPKAIRGYDPGSGRELWRLADESTQVKVPTPVAAGEVIVVTGGYPSGGRPIYGIRGGGTGALDGRALAWRAERGSPYTGTPLVYDGILYVCTDNGILSAFDAASGARIYQQRLGPDAGAFSASPVAAAGRLYLTSEDGTIFVVRAGRTFELLASNPMGTVLMATPAISGDMLIVRTLTELVGIRS
jgi:outer membrane protein assembly factor BamB